MSWLFDTLLNGRVYTRDAIIVYRILLFLIFIVHYTLIDKSMYMHECVCYIKTLSFAWIVINHFKFHSHAFYMEKEPYTRVSDPIRFISFQFDHYHRLISSSVDSIKLWEINSSND